MFVNMLPLRLLRQKLNIGVNIKRFKYFVLLPEIPEDTPETNPLLKTTALPPFKELTRHKCVNAIAKLVAEFESGIYRLDADLSDPESPKTVKNIILPLDRLSVPLQFAWATFKILHTLKADESISDAYLQSLPRILQARRQQYLSPNLYSAFKALDSSETKLAEPAQRVVRRHLLESRLSGMDLSRNQREHFKIALIKIQEHKNKYREKINRSTVGFKQELSFADVQNFPPDFLSQIADNSSRPMNGPWVVTLAPNIYQRFMELCENRTLRWNCWQAKNNLASSLSGRDLNNSIHIEEIRFNRQEQANVVGFKSFADLSMQTKMAGSVENVMALITTLRVKSQAATFNEIQDLQLFANSNGFKQQLELWDVQFWQRKHKEHLYKIDEMTIRQYFPLTSVLRGLFDFCKKIFGITIVESTPEIEPWHPDVSFYKIFDENELPIASFFLDPYERPLEKAPGAWMEIGRNRSDVTGSEPLSYLVFNFPTPFSGQPSLISFNELIILFQKFGHLLQHSLTTAPYNDVSGLSNLEWDVVNVCPLFMSYWLFNYNTIASLSAHITSGEKIPVDLHERLVKDHHYMSGLRLTEELYLSALDMELYHGREFWLETVKRLWAVYIPFPFEKAHSHVCSFSQIFCDDFPAAYYSQLWSQMISSDVFSAFEEEGFQNTDGIKKIGQRFRETYLSLGGGCHPSEVFRKFRGRDPSTDAMLCRYGLDKFVLKQLEN